VITILTRDSWTVIVQTAPGAPWTKTVSPSPTPISSNARCAV
jgi:hypothetical protein